MWNNCKLRISKLGRDCTVRVHDLINFNLHEVSLPPTGALQRYYILYTGHWNSNHNRIIRCLTLNRFLNDPHIIPKRCMCVSTLHTVRYRILQRIYCSEIRKALREGVIEYANRVSCLRRPFESIQIKSLLGEITSNGVLMHISHCLTYSGAVLN